MKTHFLYLLLLLTVSRASAQDLGVNRIMAPASGCSLSVSETVTIYIKNYNAAPYVGSVNVSYKVNLSAPVTESASVTILPGDSSLYSFITTANLSAPGTYT